MTAPFDAKAVVDAMAPMLGLTIVPEWRPSVEAHLTAAHRLAQVVLDVPLPDEAEPAPVFHP